MDVDETDEEVGGRNTNVTYQQNLQRRNERILQERDSLQSELNDLQVQNTTVCRENMDLEACNKTLQDKIKRRDTEASRLRLENDTLKREILDIKANGPIDMQPWIAQLEADKLRLQTERQELTGKVEELQQRLQQQYTESEASKLTLQTERQELTSKVEELQQHLQQHLQQQYTEIEDRNQIVLSSVYSIVSMEPVASMLEDQHLHPLWQDRRDGEYEVFIATSNDEEGFIRGTSRTISHDEAIALPAIETLIERVKVHFCKDPRAMDIYGKYLSSTTSSSIFGTFEISRTVFIGQEAVLDLYILSEACQQAIRRNSEYGMKRKRRKFSDGEPYHSGYRKK
jgi:predicted nuclease with TOPRIM domain